MTIEQHIEELRSELNNAFDATERRQIEVELELAEADLMVALAEQEGTARSRAALLRWLSP
ncbi:DNA-binding response OmpR family regulator [Rhizobium leguminosarum]